MYAEARRSVASADSGTLDVWAFLFCPPLLLCSCLRHARVSSLLECRCKVRPSLSLAKGSVDAWPLQRRKKAKRPPLALPFNITDTGAGRHKGAQRPQPFERGRRRAAQKLSISHLHEKRSYAEQQRLGLKTESVFEALVGQQTADPSELISQASLQPRKQPADSLQVLPTVSAGQSQGECP